MLCFTRIMSYLQPLGMAHIAEGAYAVLRRNHAVTLTAVLAGMMLLVRLVGAYVHRSHRPLPRNPPASEVNGSPVVGKPPLSLFPSRLVATETAVYSVAGSGCGLQEDLKILYCRLLCRRGCRVKITLCCTAMHVRRPLEPYQLQTRRREGDFSSTLDVLVLALVLEVPTGHTYSSMW